MLPQDQVGKSLKLSQAKAVKWHYSQEELKDQKKTKKILEEEYGCEVMYAVTDVGDVNNIVESVQKVMDTYGRIDILVNAAGIGNNLMVVDQAKENWDSIISINLSSVYYMCKAVGEIMIKQNYGKIINIGSIHSRVIFPGGGISAYSSAKGGVMNLTKDLAVEQAQYDITVNAICPAVFKTELTEDSIDLPGFMDLIKAYCPAGRLGEPGELDGLAIYLASDASSSCTGQLICVDGGGTAI